MPEDLPNVFDDWYEYRDYLCEHLIEDPKWQASMMRRFHAQQKRLDLELHQAMLRQHVRSILAQDWEGILVSNFEAQALPNHRNKQRKSRA
jgi:hypothetical protein